MDAFLLELVVNLRLLVLEGRFIIWVSWSFCSLSAIDGFHAKKIRMRCVVESKNHADFYRVYDFLVLYFNASCRRGSGARGFLGGAGETELQLQRRRCAFSINLKSP